MSFAEGDTEEGEGATPIKAPRPAKGGAGQEEGRGLDPAVLQVLGFAANLSLQEEEDSLGRSRDDSLAASWDPKLGRFVGA